MSVLDESTFVDDLPARIKALRRYMEWTSKDLADLTGVHWVTVSRWENGHTDPQLRHIRKMAAVAEVPVSWFFSSDDQFFPEEEGFFVEIDAAVAAETE